jgi:hypothetical protein
MLRGGNGKAGSRWRTLHAPVACAVQATFFRSINPVQAVSLEHGGPAGRQPCGFFFVGCSSPTHCAAGPSAVDAVVHTAQKQLAHVVSETLLERISWALSFFHFAIADGNLDSFKAGIPGLFWSNRSTPSSLRSSDTLEK